VVTHVFTHFELRLTVFHAAASLDAKTPEGFRWAREDALDEEALPSVMRKVAVFAADPGAR
jgi:A/G-specific adenine glycosylase